MCCRVFYHLTYTLGDLNPIINSMNELIYYYICVTSDLHVYLINLIAGNIMQHTTTGR